MAVSSIILNPIKMIIITVLETEVETKVGERVRGQERERGGGGGEEEEGRENQVLLTQNVGPVSFLLYLIVL